MRWGWPGWLLIGILFFVSGFTGLVYELVWAKYLALLLGSTAHAQIGVLAVFMGGLALGSALWGGVADRSRRPLRLYGLLEIGIACSSAVFAGAFSAVSETYHATLALLGNGGITALLVKTLLCLVAMLVPTICMGGTLPVLSRCLGLRRQRFGRGVAYLYTVNSFGAACGAVTTGFYLIPRWGFDAPYLGAALVNLVVGLLALLLSSLRESTEDANVPHTAAGDETLSVAEPEDVRGYRLLVPTAAALAGAVAMVYEVSWVRLCGLVLGASTYSFCIMLTAFILGIALGSLTYTLFHPGGDRPLRFFAYVSLGSVLLLLACLPWYDRLPFYAAQILGTLHQQRFSFAAIQTATLGFCLAVMLPLTFLSGLSFPALAHAAAKVHAGTGRPVSYVMAANTGGTIAGTVVGGLVLLPQCGLQRSFLICVGLTLCLLTVVLLCDRRLPRPQLLGVCLIAIAGFASYLALMPRWDLRLLTLGEFRRHEGLAGQTFANYYSAVTQKLLYYRDGASATVSVDEWPAEIVLRVNGKADASAFGDRETQMLLAHIPLVLRPHAEHALIIGYGSGMTAGALLRHPLKSIDVVEISPEVIDADRFFRSVNGDPLRDARTHVAIEDARTFLYQTPQRYDAIISEPSNPWIAGVSNLFTVEFFQQVKSRLRDDGVFVQWFHMYETSDDVVRLILRTLAATFPEVRGFVANGWDIILVASVRPVRLEPAESQAAFARATDLAAVDLTNLHDMLCLEILSNDLLRQLAGVGELNRDRRPLLEYAAPRAFLAGAESQMIARTQTFGLPGYLVDPNQLSVSELRALGIYLQRFDLLPYMHTVRFLAAWYRQAPLDPALHESLAKWSLDRGGSPVLIRALAQTADTLPADTRHEHAQGLLRALGAILPRPTSEQIEIAELSIAATAAATGDRELLTELENQKKRAAPATLSNGG